MSEKFWKKVAIFMVNVGKVPFPISMAYHLIYIEVI